MGKRTHKLRKPDRGRQNIKARYPNLYPTIYCTAEQMYIAVSTRPLPAYWKTRTVNGVRHKEIAYKKRITHDYFADWCCKWRDPKYKIDMTQFKVGDLVRCPHCKCEVDFRAFPSSTIPEFKEVNKDDQEGNTEELPGSQE